MEIDDLDWLDMSYEDKMDIIEGKLALEELQALIIEGKKEKEIMDVRVQYIDERIKDLKKSFTI